MDCQTKRRVLVLGGAGFIGRHVVAALDALGCQITVGSRHPLRQRRKHRAERWLEVRFECLLAIDDWRPLLADHEIVINCVGILRERGRETYDKVHHRAPAALAAACAERGLRLIHVSALGLQAAVRSGFLRSKRAGEAAIRAVGGDWHIVRPSLLDGDGGFGARWIRRVARWPLHPVPCGATGRIAALDVRDLGEAIANLALVPAMPHTLPSLREYELGGLHARTLPEHLQAMRALSLAAPAYRLPLPDMFTRSVAHVCDLLHLTPFSFGHWELLQHDNLPQDNQLPHLLGRAPRIVSAVSIAPAQQHTPKQHASAPHTAAIDSAALLAVACAHRGGAA